MSTLLSYRDEQADLMRRRRARERDVKIPAIANAKRRAAGRKNPYQFLSTYFPKRFYMSWTPNRREIIDAIVRATHDGGDQAVAAPRGEGKTSIVECLAIWAINYGILRFPLICAATGADAERILANIKAEYETNELLAADFPEICAPIHALEGASLRARTQTANGLFTRLTWSGNHVVFPTVKLRNGRYSAASGSVLATRGLDAAIRGVRYRDLRPDMVIIDDPETRESAESAVQLERREKTIEQDIGGLGGPGRKLARVMLCTIMNRTCLAYCYTDRNQKPSWNGVRHRLIESWPSREDLWQQYMQERQQNQIDGDLTGRGAHALYLSNRKEMELGAKVSNPERFIQGQESSALQHCFNIIADKGESAFLAEYQNDPPDADGPQESGITPRIVQNRLSTVAKGVVPDDAQFLTAFIDTSKTANHWVVAGWRSDATGYVIDYGVEEVWPADRESDDSIDSAIKRALFSWFDTTRGVPYRRADGDPMEISLTLVDSGYRPTPVYEFCAATGQKSFRPSKGMGVSSEARRVFSETKTTAEKRVGDRWFLHRQQSGIWLVVLDVDYWKRRVHDAFMSPADRPGGLALFGENPYEHVAFAHHICAEVEIEEFERGKGLRRRWHKRSKNNHWLDGMVGASVAASMLGARHHDISGALRKAAPAASRKSVVRNRADGRPWFR